MNFNLRLIALLPIFSTSNYSFSQVLNTSDPQVLNALGNAQVEGSPLANFFQKRTPMMDILFPLIKDDDGIQRQYIGAEIGSAYVDEDFKPGKVYYNEEELGPVYYRLNAYNNELEVKKTNLNEEKQLALIKNEEIKLITDKEDILFRSFKNDNGKTNVGYLYLLHKGDKYNLYKRIYKKFTEPKPASNSMVSPIPSRFTEYIEFYFENINENEILEIPKTKGKITNLFQNGLEINLKKIVKSNNLDLKNEKDLITLFDIIEKN